MEDITKESDAQDRLQIYSEHKIRSENLPFDIDVWYPVLQQFTFPTIFRPFTRHEGIAIMHYYQMRFMEKKIFTSFDIEILNNLENDLDILIKKNFANGAFLRLCGRSPKDAEPLEREKLVSKYLGNLAKLQAEGFPKTSNTKLIAIARTNWMSVCNGREAMSLLLTSERVFTDLHDWIKYGEPEQIVLREFCEDIRIDYEFRGFINKNQLNAISQYDHYAIYPYLDDQVPKITEKLFEKWREVHPFIGQESYVMDFLFNPNTEEVTVIEISPFLPCTGAALFHWKNTKEVLENGPFEFRLNKTIHPQLDDIVEANWEDRWKGPCPKYWEYYKNKIPDPKISSWITLKQKISIPMRYIILCSAITSCIGYYFYSYEGLITGLLVSLIPNMVLFRKYLFRKDKGLSIKPPNDQLLFVYGTLKKNFHWNHKFLNNAKFIGKAVTKEVYPLVVGDCNVPYLLGDLPGEGKNIIGELWKVDKISLAGMDDYEGVNKNYYDRRQIPVTCEFNDRVYYANAYFKIQSNAELRERPYLSEYTYEYHKKYYQPIRHIQVKQQAYLGVRDDQT